MMRTYEYKTGNLGEYEQIRKLLRKYGIYVKYMEIDDSDEFPSKCCCTVEFCATDIPEEITVFSHENSGTMEDITEKDC